MGRGVEGATRSGAWEIVWDLKFSPASAGLGFEGIDGRLMPTRRYAFRCLRIWVRRLRTAWEWICETRASVMPMVSAISFMLRSS